MEKIKKKRSWFWLALTVFSLMGQIAWVVENMYLNVFIYKTFNASAGDISAMVAASAVTATLTTVFMGALSDKIGKRKLFICGGYILWGVSIFSFVLLRTDIIGSFIPATVSAMAVGVSLTIVLDCLMTFFGSTANDAAFNAWMTDMTTSENRGKAEGINAMMPLVAVLAVFGGFMAFSLDDPSSWTVIFTIIGLLTLAVGVLGMFIIKEPKIAPADGGYLEGILYGFKPSTVKKNLTLYVTLAAFVIFNISIQIFMPYLIIYYEVSLGMTNYVIIMAPAIILASAVTALWGKVYDKKGFNLSGILALIMLLLGYAVLYFTKTMIPVFLGSFLMMSGYLSGMAVFGAMIRDNTPAGKAGRLQGIRIFSQVLVPGVVGPAIGKAVLENAAVITNNDGTTSFVPNNNIFLAAGIVAIFVLFVFFTIRSKKTPRLVKLPTEYMEELSKEEIPYGEYPRPQMRRESYLCLNGKGSFSVINKDRTVYSGEILVPFAPESIASGVDIDIKKNDLLVYERSVILPEGFNRGRILLHIDACDQTAAVFVNQKKAGQNVGGYLPFELDITELLREGENILRIEARDPLDLDLPYGKQTVKRGGMWYTKVSGIWQSVWLESVPESYIRSIKITPDLKGVDLEISGGEKKKVLVFEGREYFFFEGEKFRLDIAEPILWTPENPHLYNIEIRAGEDRVFSYFGLRTVSVTEKDGKSFIALNGNPYFCHGLLDQGYFSDGIFLPASPRGFADDILRMKKCGFNMLRKHIKLEPRLFYYYCDKYGMLVFQDMINSGKYNFLVDTALPTVGLKKGITHRASKKRREEFEKTSRGIINSLYNNPSVVYFTIFNEGWGQFDADGYYTFFKELDPTRIYDTTSGWFKTRMSDVESEHVYFKPVKLKSVKGRPLVLSEFGGYSCKIEGHSFNLDKTYGYRFFEKREKFEDALCALYENELVPAIKESGLCAAVLTQVSDVEDETNGLLTYDRRVLKVSEERMRALSESLKREFDILYS